MLLKTDREETFFFSPDSIKTCASKQSVLILCVAKQAGHVLFGSEWQI